MSANQVNTVTPRAWVGCLACYNDGRLVGEWVDAVDAESFIPCERTGHEEWWVFDTEFLPGGEMSPRDATAWGEQLADIEDIPMAIDYIEHKSFELQFNETTGRDITPDLSSLILDEYVGTFDSEIDFAQGYADAVGFDFQSPWPASSIDWEHATRELMMDYWSIPAPDYRVHVFHN